MARILAAERQSPTYGIDLSRNKHWNEAQPHRAVLSYYRGELLENPIVGFDGKQYSASDPFEPHNGVEITIDLLRALAHDANTLADIAMFSVDHEPQWWFDNKTLDKLSGYFPGNALNSYNY